ncbi:MAG: T9SS type A sorting domain-containing protein [Ignavibacteriales bacterium]|nr:T9SS type A sorting domain-containing protein [Ignavibacteriales bacterium]
MKPIFRSKHSIMTAACVFFLSLASFALAQNSGRSVVRIDSHGNQEVFPLRGMESPADVIIGRESGLFNLSPHSWPIDTLFVYDKSGAATNTAFSFTHKDVALQWYLPESDGIVREIWFQTAAGYTVGLNHRARVRAWNMDPRIVSLPATAFSTSGTDTNGNMGFYKCSTDGDGLKTPFWDEATDTAFVKGKAASEVTFDPLGKEFLISGNHGIDVDLVAGQWHKAVPDSMPFRKQIPFGFTVQNMSEVSSSPAAPLDTPLTLAAFSSLGYPYHSIKFYEGTPTSNYGWQIRAHEWKWYAIVEYWETPPPKISLQRLSTTLKTSPRTVTATIRSDGPGGLKSVELYAKINGGAYVKSAMSGTPPNYAGTLPAANPGDTVYYFVVATDMHNLTQTAPTYSYQIFRPGSKYLCLWNGRSLPTGASVSSLAAKYMKRAGIDAKQYYDVWDVKKEGAAEVSDLLNNYDIVFEATGDGGYADLTGKAAAWLSSGTAQRQKTYLLADQDHGFIGGYGEGFGADDPHNKYFGLQLIGPQDYAFTGINVTWPWKITPQDSTDQLFGFIRQYANKNGGSFWYHPNYEIPPALNWMDELKPTADAKILFTDGTRTVGVRKDAPDNSWHTIFLAFDYLSCNFRSDTSNVTYASPDKDPNYAHIYDAGSVMQNAIAAFTAVRVSSPGYPEEFRLNQNYPNPFNPATTITYDVPTVAYVSLVVYDCLGRHVATVADGKKSPGHYEERFDAGRLGSGVYFYRMTAGAYSAAKKMLVVK